jgi:hypothetical protein
MKEEYFRLNTLRLNILDALSECSETEDNEYDKLSQQFTDTMSRIREINTFRDPITGLLPN